MFGIADVDIIFGKQTEFASQVESEFRDPPTYSLAATRLGRQEMRVIVCNPYIFPSNSAVLR